MISPTYSISRVPLAIGTSANTPLPCTPLRRTWMRRPAAGAAFGATFLATFFAAFFAAFAGTSRSAARFGAAFFGERAGRTFLFIGYIEYVCARVRVRARERRHCRHASGTAGARRLAPHRTDPTSQT